MAIYAGCMILREKKWTSTSIDTSVLKSIFLAKIKKILFGGD